MRMLNGRCSYNTAKHRRVIKLWLTMRITCHLSIAKNKQKNNSGELTDKYH